MADDKLSPKQQRFVEEYLVDLNATQAAIRAGYNANSAKQQGQRLLTKDDVQAAVTAGREALAKATGITAQRVLEEYAKIGFSDLRGFFAPDGSLLPISELPDDLAAAVSSVEVVTKAIPGVSDEHLEDQPHGGALKRSGAEVEHVHKLKLWDKKGALDSVARHLGMFKDNINITGGLTLTHEQALSDLE
jgi:phage terminase small subunit